MVPLTFAIALASDLPEDDEWLSPLERSLLARLTIPKRRGDYRLGRWAAREAVRSIHPIDRPAIVVRAAADGAPELELPAGFDLLTVSIAHSNGASLAVVGPANAVFGADLELVEHRSEEMLQDFYTREERALITGASADDRDLLATVVWCGKEAALKALRVGLRWDTRDVEVMPSSETALAASAWHTLSARTFDGARTELRGCWVVFSFDAKRWVSSVLGVGLEPKHPPPATARARAALGG
ncbi:MAG: 4'-phosphopantetheinyl transferase superfamily protein [Polyangiaceae bacterium]